MFESVGALQKNLAALRSFSVGRTLTGRLLVIPHFSGAQRTIKTLKKLAVARKMDNTHGVSPVDGVLFIRCYRNFSNASGVYAASPLNSKYPSY